MKTCTVTALLFLTAPAWAAPLAPLAPVETPAARWLHVSGNCYGPGERAAREAGGTMVGVRAAVKNGRPVCIVVVSVPAPDGTRPRLQEITVPQ